MGELKFVDAEGLGKEVINGNKSLNAIFGIGLSSKYYSKENLTLYAKWASEHLNSLLFIIADDVQRYNIMGFDGLNKKEALKKARKIGDEKFLMVKKISDKFPHKVEVKRWAEVTSTSEYKKIFSLLEKDYNKIPELKEHIDNTLWANIRFKLEELKNNVGDKEFKKRFRILVKYAIEEISLIIYLAEYNVYPIKIGHNGERVYDNIVDRIYSKHYNKVHGKILPKNKRGNIYLQVVESK